MRFVSKKNMRCFHPNYQGFCPQRASVFFETYIYHFIDLKNLTYSIPMRCFIKIRFSDSPPKGILENFPTSGTPCGNPKPGVGPRSCLGLGFLVFHIARTQGVKENINPLAGKTFSVSRCKTDGWKLGLPTWYC